MLKDLSVKADKAQEIAGGGDPSPKETLSLNYAEVKWTYTQQ